MKLLVVSHEYPPIGGGGANACFFLTREYAKQGHSVTVLTAQFQDLPAEEITDAGVNIVRVQCKRANKEKSSFYEMFTFLISAYKKADYLLKKQNFDKCLVFFGIPSGPIALHLKRKYKLPYIVRFGGGDIPGAQKRFKYVYMILAPIIRCIWKNADYLIANSEGLKKRAQAFEEKYPITVIENGVDNQFFCPIERQDRDTVHILFVSRLIEGKGLQFVIPKLLEVQNQVFNNCGKKIHLTIVGDGPYRDNLEELVHSTNTEHLVSFEGRKDKKQVKAYYQAADIFILPSLSEGMPNVVLEAMACGLPIIMTPCEGSKELVTDNGIISELVDFDKNLTKLCSDDILKKTMGQNSVHNIQNNFQWGKIANRYMEVLQK